MKNTFVYAKKDSYTQAEMDSLLEQNTKFARMGYLEKTESLETTLKEHKAMKEAAEIAEFTKGLTERLEKAGVTSTDKILKYGKFNKDMNDEEFKDHLDSMKADFPESFKEKSEFKDDEFITDTNEGGKQDDPVTYGSRITGGVFA